MSLYLTKADLGYDTAAHAGLRDSYQWHQKVWDAFPGRPNDSRDFLTRVDELNDRLRLLLLSQTIPSRPTWCPETAWQSKEIPEEFFENTSFRFSLIANTIKRSKEHGKRVALKTPEERSDWLLRKASDHGFQIAESSLEARPLPPRRFIKKGTAGKHAATEFIGALKVTDREKFLEAFQSGIGPAKAFGFGMLCLAPL